MICYKEVFLLDSVLIFLLLISRREITTRRRSGCSSECCCFRTKLWSRVKIIVTTDNENRNTSVNLSWVMFVRDKQAHSRSGVHHIGIIKSSRHRIDRHWWAGRHWWLNCIYCVAIQNADVVQWNLSSNIFIGTSYRGLTKQLVGSWTLFQD